MKLIVSLVLLAVTVCLSGCNGDPKKTNTAPIPVPTPLPTSPVK
ncbi:MAG: hypothetical protein QM703_09185 [Gemmatales bacterium]